MTFQRPASERTVGEDKRKSRKPVKDYQTEVNLCHLHNSIPGMKLEEGSKEPEIFLKGKYVNSPRSLMRMTLVIFKFCFSFCEYSVL